VPFLEASSKASKVERRNLLNRVPGKCLKGAHGGNFHVFEASQTGSSAGPNLGTGNPSRTSVSDR
jgi:hypothetical protein